MNDNLTPYKQIYPIQLPKLYSLGYRTVINIRPDGEADTQPSNEALAVAAAQAYLSYTYLPFASGHLKQDTITQFAMLYHSLPKPILMVCRTGSRAKLLYQSALMQGLL